MKKGQQHVEHRHRIGQASFNIVSDTMKYLLSMTHYRLHRKVSFNDHAFIPGSFWAQLEISRDALFTAKAQISQGNGYPVQTFNSWAFLGNHFQPTTRPRALRIQHNLMPIDHRPLSLFFLPTC
jgi:hypothetical protein